MWCQSCKALQITPEDKIYKAAKHKKIELKNKKVIHLLHFNERESSASAVVANGAEPNATMENYNNIATSQILIARNTFEDPPNPLTPLPTISNTFTDVRPLSAVRTEQPRPLTAHVNEAFTANESSSSSSYNKKDQASHTQGDVSIQLKPDPSSAVSRALSELNKPLESYDTFSRFLNSTKFKPSFRGGFDCLEGDTTLGYSVFFRRKIRLDTLGLESKMSHFDVNMNNLQAQMACPNLPLLFYIHGVGGSSLIWKSQLEFFNDRGYEIIAMDLIGHGASSVVNEPKMYEFLEMSSDILQIFDMFATKSNNNVVIGHSYGASFATYLAQHRKNFITKLILIAGGAPYPLEYRSAFLNSPLCCIKVFKPVLNCRFYCSAFSSYCNLPPNSSEAFKVPTNVLFYTMKGQTWLTGDDQYHRVAKHCVLMIEGERDAFVPLEDSMEMIRLLRYAYLVVFDKGSHMLVLEKADVISRLLYLFINDSFK